MNYDINRLSNSGPSEPPKLPPVKPDKSTKPESKLNLGDHHAKTESGHVPGKVKTTWLALTLGVSRESVRALSQTGRLRELQSSHHSFRQLRRATKQAAKDLSSDRNSAGDRDSTIDTTDGTSLPMSKDEGSSGSTYPTEDQESDVPGTSEPQPLVTKPKHETLPTESITSTTDTTDETSLPIITASSSSGPSYLDAIQRQGISALNVEHATQHLLVQAGVHEHDAQAVARTIQEIVSTGQIGGAALTAGTTYKHNQYGLPFSIDYKGDGIMIIKLKTKKGIRTLGKGSFGMVTKAIQIDLKAVEEAKSVKMAAQKTHKRKGLSSGIREQQMFGLCQGIPGLITMSHAEIYTGTEGSPFGGEGTPIKKHGMIMEFCNEGDVFTYVSSGKFAQLPEAIQLSLARQILVTLQGMHERGVIHLDMKPRNILLTSIDGKLETRVTDLGTAMQTSERIQKLTGTKEFIAPEISDMTEELVPTPAMDCYSTGQTFAMMFAPKDANGQPNIASLTDPMRSIVDGLMAESPEARMTIGEAIFRIDQHLG